LVGDRLGRDAYLVRIGEEDRLRRADEFPIPDPRQTAIRALNA